MCLWRKWKDVNLASLLVFFLLEPLVAFLGMRRGKHLAQRHRFGASMRTGAPSVNKGDPAGSGWKGKPLRGQSESSSVTCAENRSSRGEWLLPALTERCFQSSGLNSLHCADPIRL